MCCRAVQVIILAGGLGTIRDFPNSGMYSGSTEIILGILLVTVFILCTMCLYLSGDVVDSMLLVLHVYCGRTMLYDILPYIYRGNFFIALYRCRPAKDLRVRL